MYVKFSPKNLNLSLCSAHPTSIYTCGVVIALRMRSGLVEYNYKVCYLEL